MTEQSAEKRRAELGLVAMAMIWGINFSVVKAALDVFEPLTFNALRHLAASIFMLVVLAARGAIGRPARADVGRIVGLGVIGIVIYQMAFIIGLDRTRAGNAALMLALVPVFMLAFGPSSARRGVQAWLGAIVSVGGVALVSGSTIGLSGSETLVGDALMLGAAAVWAIYTLGAATLIDRYGPLRVTAWTLWVGSIGLVLSALPALGRQDWGAAGLAAWGGVLFSSVFAIGLAYLLWYGGVQTLGPARTAIFSNLTPVVALAAGALMLGERLTVYAIIGAAMVIGGVAIVRRTGAAAVPGRRTYPQA